MTTKNHRFCYIVRATQIAHVDHVGADGPIAVPKRGTVHLCMSYPFASSS